MKKNSFIFSLVFFLFVTFSFASSDMTSMDAFAADFGNSRIVSLDDKGRPQIMIDGNEDPYLYTLSKWYGFSVEDCQAINPYGYNHQMLYTLPVTVEKYYIPARMGLYGISKIYDVSQEAIKHLNALEDDSIIYAGDFLYIPIKWEDSFVVETTPVVTTTMTTTFQSTTTQASTTIQSTSAIEVATSTQTTTTTTSSTEQTTTSTEQITTSTTIVTTTTLPEDCKTKYQIKPGDILGKIAEKYETTISALMNLNPWIQNANLIYPGKWLLIPNENYEVTIPENSTQHTTGVHYVVEGEYLGIIAAKYNTTVKALLKLNPEITDPNYIYIGQPIKVVNSSSNTSNSDTSNSDTSSNNSSTVKLDFSNEMYLLMEELKKKYPTMRIGVGLYTPNGSYTYNSTEKITGCCTIKASYALYVIKTCVKNNIDIFTTKLKYQSWHYNSGSGDIKKQPVGTTYTIYELLYKLLVVSDNTAYNILTSRFSLPEFFAYNRSIGGQDDGYQYGSASVQQRYAEWSEIIEYIHSDAKYADKLYNMLDVAQYGYIEQGMTSWHNVLHKSGWSTGSYTGAGDVAYIDDEYLLIVMTDDKPSGIAHTDVVRAIGNLFDRYY